MNALMIGALMETVAVKVLLDDFADTVALTLATTGIVLTTNVAPVSP